MPMKKKVKKAAKKVVKKVAKKANLKKTVAKKNVVSKQQPKLSAISKPYNGTQIVRYLAGATDLQKKDILSVIDALTELLGAHLKKGGPKEFTLLGLAKFRLIHKPATKARQGINPFNGEQITFAAKPARNVVKIKPLKKIKEMVS